MSGAQNIKIPLPLSFSLSPSAHLGQVCNTRVGRGIHSWPKDGQSARWELWDEHLWIASYPSATSFVNNHRWGSPFPNAPQNTHLRDLLLTSFQLGAILKPFSFPFSSEYSLTFRQILAIIKTHASVFGGIGPRRRWFELSLLFPLPSPSVGVFPKPHAAKDKTHFSPC